VSETQPRYSPRKIVNLYSRESRDLWDSVSEHIREEHDATGASEGEIAAQAFAECLGEPGPFDGDR
jgi:hypothetical protein